MAEALADAGVEYLFGYPGGGSNLELMQAAADVGIPFVLTHTEGAAGFMAAAYGELTGRPGVCLATLGPGAASLINASAHGLLDRAPMLVVTDRHPATVNATMLHQRLDHEAMFAPVTKAQFTFRDGNARTVMEQAIGLAVAPLPGPVHLDLPSDEAVAVATPAALCELAEPLTSGSPELDQARRLVASARRPVALIGMAATNPSSAAAVHAFVEAHGIPFLTTYKGKGVVPEPHPLGCGLFTGGVIEREIVDQADLILAFGVDPVEFIPKVWGYTQPTLYVSPWPLPGQRQFTPDVCLVGDLAALLPALGADGVVSDWDRDALTATLRSHYARIAPQVAGLMPSRVVQIVREQSPPETIATVDAGAHMFPATTFWQVRQPKSFLISNGLATMGFAVPAGICAALLHPMQQVVAFTGDGGMLMTVGELETAARLGVKLTVIVFDDRSLSLIKIKQLQRKQTTAGTDFAATDFPALARSLGITGLTASSELELRDVLAEANRHEGPVLISARIDPSGYSAMLRAIRG
ncbi:MAG: thiamine pyrophosphate-binding protein [Dehalococcoidia bacterium]